MGCGFLQAVVAWLINTPLISRFRWNCLVQWSCSMVLFKGLVQRSRWKGCYVPIMWCLSTSNSFGSSRHVKSTLPMDRAKTCNHYAFCIFFVITLHIPQHKQSYNKANWAVTYQFPTDLSSPHSFPVFDNYPVYQLHHLSTGASRVHEPYIRWTPSHRDLSPKPLTQYPCPNHSLT